VPDLAVFLSNNTLKNANKFSALMKLEGDASVLEEALSVFKDIPKVPKPWNNLHYKHRTQHLYGIRKP
jgi:hypothetical protein